MSITKDSIETLGFKFLDYDEQTNFDYTFEKKGSKHNHYVCMIWQPESNEITITQYYKIPKSGLYSIERVYHGFPTTVEEIKGIIQEI